MANRRFQDVQALQKQVKKVHVKITTDGSADVSSFSGTGVSNVSHEANVYTITLDDKYNDFMAMSVISGVSADFHIDSVDVSSAKTIAVEASVAQNSTDIYVEMVLKNSSVVK